MLRRFSLSEMALSSLFFSSSTVHVGFVAWDARQLLCVFLHDWHTLSFHETKSQRDVIAWKERTMRILFIFSSMLISCMNDYVKVYYGEKKVVKTLVVIF